MADDDYLVETRALNAKGLKQLEGGFSALNLNYIPSKGNFITVDVGGDAVQIYEKLLHEGVIVRPISGYDLPNHLRVSVGTAEQNELLLKALKKVLTCV